MGNISLEEENVEASEGFGSPLVLPNTKWDSTPMSRESQVIYYSKQ